MAAVAQKQSTADSNSYALQSVTDYLMSELGHRIDPAPMTLLGGLAPAEFLSEYWQKKPLLIRQAFSALQTPLAPEDLAGLACEAGVESRLVLRRDKPPEWVLKHGPFDEAEFGGLPATHWTLLVQDVEKHLPDLAWIPDRFAFIPSWRIDDLMVSYAAPGGTVGPHVDHYDVFLLQGLGRRRWQIDPEGQRYTQRADTGLKLIEKFNPTAEWTLEPGDMLYLPPRVAHYGVALDECMTYSIGFRAPSHQEMLADFLGLLAEQAGPDARYADPDLQPAAAPGKIDPAALAQVRMTLKAFLQPHDAEIDHWFARFITEPKPGLEDEPPEQPLGGDDLKRIVAQNVSIRRSATARFAWLPAADGGAELFVAGTRYAVQDDDLAALLCRHRVLPLQLLRKFLECEDTIQLLTKLYNAGHIAFERFPAPSP
jgi:50S ribosomal protein L16 3-hydroxylase